MARLSDDPIKTFTVGFEEDHFDESWAAREVAEYNGTDHTTYTVTPDDVREAVPSVLDRLGEPFADQSLVPTYVVARETSNDVKVALSGDGADELFAGYARHRGEYFSKYYRKLPRVLKTGLVERVVGQMQTSRSSRRGEFVRKARKFTRADVSEVSDRHFQLVRIPDSRAVRAFDRIDPERDGVGRMREEHDGVEAILPADRHDPLSTIMAVDARFGLPNQILPKSDLASMYNSLEVRVPFLDRSVVEFAMSLPLQYKITPTKQKRILRHAFDEELPESILSRGKQGFDMPIGEWFRSELAGDFRSTLGSIETDIIDTSEVASIFEEHQSGSHHHGDFLWSVFVFTKWLSRMKREGVID